MERFDKAQNNNPAAAPEPAPTANGANHDEDDEDVSPKKRKASSGDESDLSDVADSPPPKKAKKKSKPEAESDEAFARNLQAEINGEKRATRGGGTTKKKPAAKQAKKPKKKSSTKISAADDSDLASGSEKPEKEKKGGFHVRDTASQHAVHTTNSPLQKLMALSEPLSAMLGQPALSRPQTVKQIWAYVKERDLQDPSDKRQIRCDEKMHAVFKQDKVHMFTMNKLLASHLHPMEEE